VLVGAIPLLRTRFQHVDNETHKKQSIHVPFMLLDRILAHWQHPVASNEALDLLHLAMHAVTYRRTTMAIKMASIVGEFVHRCLFACCPGGRWGNMEQVVSQWRHPVACGIDLDMLHRAMLFVLHWRTAMAIKTTGRQGTFDCH
jgi:hypothetical protein